MSGVFRKPDKKGRSSSRLTGRRKELFGPPKDGRWVGISMDLLASPPFQALSINARKIFDYLLVCHGEEQGRENGQLKAPYDALVRFGVSRRLISLGFAELLAGGFVALVRQGGIDCGHKVLSLYRLTNFADAQTMTAATNEWRNRSEADVRAARALHAQIQVKRKSRSSAKRNSDKPGNVFAFRKKQTPGSP